MKNRVILIGQFKGQETSNGRTLYYIQVQEPGDFQESPIPVRISEGILNGSRDNLNEDMTIGVEGKIVISDGNIEIEVNKLTFLST